MKTCACGQTLKDDELLCPNCGKQQDIDNSDADALSTFNLSLESKDYERSENPALSKDSSNNSQPKPVEPEQNDGDASSIFSVFQEPEKVPEAKKTPVKKPETPKPSSKIEVKPVANASSNPKFNPLKNPPPVESPYSVLNMASTIVNVFFMSIPIIGIIYAVIITLSSKKQNVRVLATAFLSVFMLFVCVTAIIALVLSLFFKPEFYKVIKSIEYILHSVTVVFAN